MAKGSTRRRDHSRRLGNIEHDILAELSLGDLLYAHLCSARSTRRFYKIARERATANYRRRLAIERLKADGYINEHGSTLRITSKGESALNSVIEHNKVLLKTKRWDGKWRIAAFDIPEIHSSLRNRIRELLKRSGFIILQQSIWIFPHDCEELVQLIKEDARVSKHLLYGVLERIENEAELKQRFGLH